LRSLTICLGRASATLLLALAVALTPARADAGSCSFTSVVGVGFGTYNVFSVAPLDSTGSVTYACTGVASVSIELGKGSASSFLPRRMIGPSGPLTYNLYTNAAHTVIWGDGTAGTSAYSLPSPPDGSGVTVTIYGEISARQNIHEGFYADTITVTMNF
jgi:spore coat protein U-like protein